MALVAARIGADRRAVQLHLGGGTPTFFNEDELRQLMVMLRSHFEFTPDAEPGVEIDPRTVKSGTLSMLAGSALIATAPVDRISTLQCSKPSIAASCWR